MAYRTPAAAYRADAILDAARDGAGILPRVGSGADKIALAISEDRGSGVDALFTISVDGVQIGGTQTAQADHASGATQIFTVRGNFDAGPHVVTVDFINASDEPATVPGNDRNLYVQSITDAGLVTVTNAELAAAGAVDFTVQPPSAVLHGHRLSGPAGGYGLLKGTLGDDRLVAHGAGNTILGRGGNDTIRAVEGGGQFIDIGAVGDGMSADHDWVSVGGANDIVSGGDASVALTGAASDAAVTLGNGNNAVSLRGAGNTVAAGDGDNAISALGGHAVVTVGRGLDQVSSFSDSVAIDGTHNSVGIAVYGANEPYATLGNVTVGGGRGDDTIFVKGGGTITEGGMHNSIAVGTGSFSIVAGSGFDSVEVAEDRYDPGSVATIQLAGTHNSVSGGGSITVVGGSGHARIDLDGGTVVTDGVENRFNLVGADTVSAGSGYDRVSIDGGSGMLTFQGPGNVLDVTDRGGSSFSAVTISVGGAFDGLQVHFNSAYTSLEFASFGGTDVLQLPKYEGFATADQAYGALAPDGAGGFVLAVHGGTIHFDAGSQLSAGNFAIR